MPETTARASATARETPRATFAFLQEHAAWVVLAIGALLVPALATSPYALSVWVFAAVNAIVVVGLCIMFGWAGQLSLGHGAFVSFGAYTSAILTTQHGAGPLLAVLVGMLIASLSAVAIGVASLRLQGYYLAMVTLGFPVILQAALQYFSDFSGGSSGIAGVERLAVGPLRTGTIVSVYWLVLTVLVVVTAAAYAITRTNLARQMVAVKDDQEAAEARGVSSAKVKIIALVISAAIAALGGSLYVHFVSFVSPTTFGVTYSIHLVVMLIVGGRHRLWGAIVGAIVLTWLPELVGGSANVQLITFGVLLAAVMIVLPGGVASIRFGRRSQAVPPPAGGEAADTAADPRAAAPVDTGDTGRRVRNARRSGPPVLVLSDLSKAFGGLQAVADVSMEVSPGEVRGIIGPNGAGKSTLLGMIGGQVTPDRGEVRLDGRPVDDLTPTRRSRLGLSRTFQNVRIFPSLTVAENVGLVPEHGPHAGRRPATGRTADAARLGLEEAAARYPDALTHKARRYLEILSVLSSDTQVLLLDEPAAGLASNEVGELTMFLRSVRDRGIAIVVVDHVLELIVDLCDTVTVLDHGRVLTTGAPREVLDDPRVQEAYLAGTYAG